MLEVEQCRDRRRAAAKIPLLDDDRVAAHLDQRAHRPCRLSRGMRRQRHRDCGGARPDQQRSDDSHGSAHHHRIREDEVGATQEALDVVEDGKLGVEGGS